MLKKVTGPNNIYDSYEYDEYGREIAVTSYYIEEEKSFTTRKDYDENNRVVEITYPSGFAISYLYNNYGYLNEVKRKDNSNTIWKAGAMNEFGQWKDYTLGNNLLMSEFGYDANGMPETIKTKRISDNEIRQNLEYSFNLITGNLTNRKDHMHKLGENSFIEEFGYDNLNRLEWYKLNGGTQQYMVYDNNKTGVIQNKALVGEYLYEEKQPHAISLLNSTQTEILPNVSYTYTPFNKVNSIILNDKSYTITYGPDYTRRKSVSTINNNTKSTWYNGLYEMTEENGSTRHYYYIPGGDGLAAIYMINNDQSAMYYIHKDHLGSYNLITDENGNVVAENSFDPWGRRRNPADWSYENISVNALFSRGFTGHEHLDAFGVINMNGRVYDPVLGIFLSPDNYVQAPDFTQNFNRYAYCLNNPLKYTDPSGYWFGIDDAIAAGLGFVVGYISYGVATGNFGWKAVAAGGVGAAVAWVGWNTMGVGAAALANGAGSASSFSAGMTAVFGSASGSYGVQFASLTFMNTMMNQDNLNAADEKGWDGVWAFGAYSASAVLSTSLNPSSIAKAEGFRAWVGTVLTDNISDNMENGKFSSSRYHIGFLGYDFDKKEGYSIFSKGLDKGQRFDMAFETVLGFTQINKDIDIHYRLPWKDNCGKFHWGHLMQRFYMNTSQIGYYAKRGLELWNSYYLITEQQTIYQHWYNQHYNDDGTAIY